MNDTKTHYRKVFKSDHLAQADLEDLQENGSNLIFTIAYVKQEIQVAVAGRKGNHNIAYFQEKIKPMVLNATNSKTLKGFIGGSPFVEDWKDMKVQLFIDPSVRMKGETVGGVRIHPNQPASRQQITPEGKNGWKKATVAYLRDGDFKAVLEKADISQENQNKIIEECSQGG